jgi:hypothetical protein
MMSQVQEQKTEKPEQPLTEVTSVAKEELKTGVKVQTPTAEELVHRANSSFMAGLVELENIFKSGKLSQRGMRRATIAILSLPQEGLPVGLQKGLEQYAFALGQRIIRDRFIITQYHVAQEQKIYKQLLDLKKVQDEVIEKMKADGKSEEEIKALQEKHKEIMLQLEQALRGELDEKELPVVPGLEEKTETDKGETNEKQ